MRAIAWLVLFGCGTKPIETPHNAVKPDPEADKPTCRSAIESWYANEEVEPVPDRQRVFIAGCEQDGWSREVRKCFVDLRSTAPTYVGDCKDMLTKPQRAKLQERIKQTGEKGLDLIDI